MAVPIDKAEESPLSSSCISTSLIRKMAPVSRLQVQNPQPPQGYKGYERVCINDITFDAGEAKRPVLLKFDEMPAWFRRESNPWILHGYRPISGSAHASFYERGSVSINPRDRGAPFEEWYWEKGRGAEYDGLQRRC